MLDILDQDLEKRSSIYLWVVKIYDIGREQAAFFTYLVNICACLGYDATSVTNNSYDTAIRFRQIDKDNFSNLLSDKATLDVLKVVFIKYLRSLRSCML